MMSLTFGLFTQVSDLELMAILFVVNIRSNGSKTTTGSTDSSRYLVISVLVTDYFRKNIYLIQPEIAAD